MTTLQPVPKLPTYEANKARIFLALACFWPFLLLALFASSAPRVVVPASSTADEILSNQEHHANSKNDNTLRLSLRNVLDRVDIMGYGPTHPRIGVVVTGDARASDKSHWVATVESVFSHTDLSRIFVVAVVVDGHGYDAQWENDLKKIHSGEIPHLHGLHYDLHDKVAPSKKKQDEASQLQSKVHVMFNEEPQGITSSRKDGAEFVHILAKHHENAGLKSTSEDIILVLMHAGVVLQSRQWLPTVTQSLIVPPPLLPNDGGAAGSSTALKLANAVSFNVEGVRKRTSFDALLTPLLEDAGAEELNQSSGASYMAPVWSGAALALRLETWRQLPMHDEALHQAWMANLDLSLALWLCADGMDMVIGSTGADGKDNGAGGNALAVKWVDPKLNPSASMTAPLAPAVGARFAEAWMDEGLQRKFFHLYTHTYNELTYLEWQTFQAQARQSPTFVADLAQKCRSLEWYIDTVNPHLSTILEQSAIVDQPAPAKEQDAADAHAEVPPALREQEPAEPEKPKEKAESGEATEEEEEESVAIPARRELVKPSKPLCDECLKIIEQAKPVSLEYVDVSGGHKEHPHMGAKDAEGNLGFVHNETSLFRNPPAFGMAETDLLNACKRRDNNYKMLTEQVYVDLKGDKEAQEKLGADHRAKIFCLVYTTEKGHENIPRIRETWGQKCDGFMVGSTATDPSIGAVNIVHEGPEEYENIWQKVRSMWAYIYDHYYEHYDWFHIGGDDYYLLVENLRLYLESEEIRTAQNGGTYLPDGSETMQVPMFLGRRFAYMGNMDDIFNSGGSGYTINKAALKTLVVEGLPNSRQHLHTFSEDTVIARMFRTFGILPYETKDAAGGERYMPFMPGHHYGYRMPARKEDDWYARYSINIKTGKDHCAAKSVAFHYVKGLAMYRLHALLYGLCPDGTL